MVAVEVKALTLVQAMGVVASVAGIKVNRITSAFASVLNEPLEESARVAAMLFSRQGHEIVDVKNCAPGEKLAETKSSCALHRTLMPER
jgi:hypothetical protein